MGIWTLTEQFSCSFKFFHNKILRKRDMCLILKGLLCNRRITENSGIKRPSFDSQAVQVMVLPHPQH